MGAQRTTEQITAIVIHCADTPNGRDDHAEDIDRWHGERNFNRDLSIAPSYQPHLKHIGYHFVIELSGRITPARPLVETGAHVAGRNHDTVGICMIGRDKFTDEQWQSVHALVRALKAAVPTITRVAGHRELNTGKTCPGFDVPQWIYDEFSPAPENVLSVEGE